MSYLHNDNFCIQPWIHFSTWNDGAVPLCCVATPERDLNLNVHTIKECWNSEQFKSARRQFLADERPGQCQHCWREEDSGVKSHRQIENDYWITRLGQEFLDARIANTLPDGGLIEDPITLDLRLGNTCNLQCVMCRPRDSSRWLADGKKLIEILTTDAVYDWRDKIAISSQEFEWFEQNRTIQSLEEIMGSIRHVIFGGGEPLLIKQHLRFIQNLVASGSSKNIELRYHTNGTQLSDDLLELWSKFKHVELMISIDDWEQRNSWIRYPADWPTIMKNLDRLDQTSDNITIRILTSVHALNIYTLPEFATSLLAQGYKKIGRIDSGGLFSVGTVHWPRYLNTQVLPLDVKHKIQEHWNRFSELEKNERWATRIKTQIDYMMANDQSHLFPQLVDYLDSLNEIRPVHYQTVYSEYYQVLGL